VYSKLVVGFQAVLCASQAVVFAQTYTKRFLLGHLTSSIYAHTSTPLYAKYAAFLPSLGCHVQHALRAHNQQPSIWEEKQAQAEKDAAAHRPAASGSTDKNITGKAGSGTGAGTSTGAGAASSAAGKGKKGEAAAAAVAGRTKKVAGGQLGAGPEEQQQLARNQKQGQRQEQKAGIAAAAGNFAGTGEAAEWQQAVSGGLRAGRVYEDRCEVGGVAKQT
jgi:hypothetical protein